MIERRSTDVGNRAAARPNGRSMGDTMESERWLEQRLQLLRMQSLVLVNGPELPDKIERRFFDMCDPDEKNRRGETLLVCATLYITDMPKQVKYVNLLLRSGADPNLAEEKHLRTPLMLACTQRNEGVVRMLVAQSAISLTEQDRLGNTALMYAVLSESPNIVNVLVDELTRKWSFDVFRTQNCMGHTAETLAVKNGRADCERLLRRERLQMLQRMHRQLDVIQVNAQMKGWGQYATMQKARTAFRRASTRGRFTAKLPGVPTMAVPRVVRTRNASVCATDVARRNAFTP